MFATLVRPTSMKTSEARAMVAHDLACGRITWEQAVARQAAIGRCLSNPRKIAILMEGFNSEK